MWMNRMGALALVVAGVLLLGGCASPRFTNPLKRTSGTGLGVEIRPDAPADYDVLVAIDHESRRDHLKALAAYERALLKDPDSAFIHLRLAMRLAMSGRPGKSLEHAERALEIEPDKPDTRLFLGQLHRLRRDSLSAASVLLDEAGVPINDGAAELLYQIYLEAGDFENAIGLANWRIDLDPTAIEGYLALAKAHAVQGDHEKAERAMRSALERDPENMRIFVMLARSARDRDDSAAERAVYQEIFEIYPQHHATLIMLSDIQLKEDDTDGLRQTLLEIEERYPEDLRSILRLAFLDYEMERLDEAATRFERYLTVEPRDTEVRFFLGIVRRRTGEDDLAIEAFSGIAMNRKNYAEARTQLALIYEGQRDYKLAFDEIEKALAEGPTRSRELFAATLRSKSGDFDGAVAYMEELLLQSPHDDELLYNLGVIYGEAKLAKEAIMYMERAIEQNGKNANALNYVGYTWAERGENLDQAEDYIVRALDLRPDDGFIIDSLGWVYYMRARPLVDLGKKEEAAQYIERALEELLRAAELTGGDPVVSEHLGDVYFLMDQKERALEVYQEAVELTPREGEQPHLFEKIESLQSELE
jgi:tetratricopeptide (TPR) repeat protein